MTSRRVLGHRGTATLVAAVVVSLLTFGVATPAAAAVSVSGTVTGETSGGPQPMSGVKVQLFSMRGDGMTVTAQATTNGSGQFSISGVTTGTKYNVFFSSQDNLHASEWRGDSPYEAQSTFLQVNTSDVTGLNAELAIGGSISGTVTTSSGNAVASAFLWDPELGQFEHTPFTAVTSGGAYDINGLPMGEYLLRFAKQDTSSGTPAKYWKVADLTWDADAVVVSSVDELTGYDATISDASVSVERITGANRYETSVAISQAGFDHANVVFVVSGTNYPDGLAAGPAAAALNGPVLLTDPAAISAEVLAEIARLNPTLIVAVGGIASVSDNAVSQLEGISASSTVKRITGGDRNDTSRQLARFAFDGNDVHTAYLTTGLNFVDALAAGAGAANDSGPLLLDSGSGTIDTATSQLLQDLDIERVVIAAGTSAIPAATANALAAVPGVTSVIRRTGVDRYNSSAVVGQGSFGAADTVFLAVGDNYPDGLSAAGLAGQWRSPIYLAQQSCVPATVLADIRRLAPRKVIILGGSGALGVGVENLASC